MKRNPNLVNLSSEHHDGLVIALRLKKAIGQNIDHQILTNYIQALWPALKNHFAQEEDNFISNKHIDKAHALVQRMLEEHQEFEQLQQRINNTNPNLQEDLLAFSQLLTTHIRFEERELFPYLEAAIPEEELKAIGKQLALTHQSLDSNLGPDFWNK